MSRILITGAAGGLAEIVAEKLKDEYELVGVDPRPMPEGRKFPGKFFQIDYRQRKMADVFRLHDFEALIHLGRVPSQLRLRKTQRFNLNVLGTRSLLELSLKYKVRSVIVLSTFHVYGAHQHNHLYITEEDPLLASQTYSEVVDAVELDNVSVAFSLRNPKVRTVILRPTNIIGLQIKNQMSNFLRSKVCPTLLGYDPMWQFIHESDMANAVQLALEGKKAGIYNVSGEGVIALSHAIELTGATNVPVPEFLSGAVLGGFKIMGQHFPRHLVDFFKYPVVISDKNFRKDFGYEPKILTADALRGLKPENSIEEIKKATEKKTAPGKSGGRSETPSKDA